MPFAEVLSSQPVQETFDAEGVTNIDCVYPPLTTVRMLLAQALDPDPSLRQAVSRLLAERAAAGHGPISAATGAYSQARSRLPEGVLTRLARRVGAELLEPAPDAWSWKGRHVKIVDGTTVLMPDTPANQAAWPQPPHERPGLGFPLARLVVVFSLAVGTVWDAARGPYTGLVFAPHVVAARRRELPALAEQIRAAIVQHRVGDRPDRYEPRARKRRYDNYQPLRIPHTEAKARLRRGTYE